MRILCHYPDAARCTTPRLPCEPRVASWGLMIAFVHDAGAYVPYGFTVPLNSQSTLLGQYDVRDYYYEFTSVFTNKPIVTPSSRGGRQHGVFVMERLLDIAARELGIDRVEIRRRNLIAPDQFPYNNQIIYQDFAPLVYIEQWAASCAYS